MFFGKPLIVCLQTGHSALLSRDDVEKLEDLQRIYNLRSRKEAEEISEFLQRNVPFLTLDSG